MVANLLLKRDKVDGSNSNTIHARLSTLHLFFAFLL